MFKEGAARVEGNDPPAFMVESRKHFEESGKQFVVQNVSNPRSAAFPEPIGNEHHDGIAMTHDLKEGLPQLVDVHAFRPCGQKCVDTSAYLRLEFRVEDDDVPDVG